MVIALKLLHLDLERWQTPALPNISTTPLKCDRRLGGTKELTKELTNKCTNELTNELTKGLTKELTKYIL